MIDNNPSDELQPSAITNSVAAPFKDIERKGQRFVICINACIDPNENIQTFDYFTAGYQILGFAGDIILNGKVAQSGVSVHFPNFIKYPIGIGSWECELNVDGSYTVIGPWLRTFWGIINSFTSTEGYINGGGVLMWNFTYAVTWKEVQRLKNSPYFQIVTNGRTGTSTYTDPNTIPIINNFYKWANIYNNMIIEIIEQLTDNTGIFYYSANIPIYNKPIVVES